ncbi:protein MCM10 homolog isoform X2 [Periplaneta americana]
MSSREAIPLARLKRHVSSENTSADWVVAGVVIHKSQMKMSQKGFQYYIWKLTDLKEDIKTFSLFLFRAAAKDLWKTKEGTVIAILNPSILDNRDSSGDEATLSIDNAQRVLILGPSKDMGICRARKKNGDNCTSIVNKSKCEYCVYHLKQEYRKCSSRAELQSGGLVNIRNKVLGKNEVFYAGKSFTAIPAKRNWKQQEKDDQRLRSLSLSKNVNTRTPLRTQQLMSTMLTKQSKPLIQKQSDSERLLKLQKGVQTTTSTVSVNDEYSAVSLVRDPANQKFVTPDIPKLDRGCDEIDLNAPISKAQKEQAKINAKKWIRTHGPIKKKDPNSVKKDKSSFKIENPIKISSAGSQGTSAVVPPPTKPFSSSRFQELMNATSKHSELLQANEEKKQEEYFEKLEKKEQLELKMLETYKIACKAVRCMKCKYTAFSASDMCRSESHPLKVLDAVKRFFKCGHCTNRTVTLDLIPLHPCKNCGNSNWMRAPMIREKKGCLLTESLSIRGDEETFLGSVSTQANVNLLIPE